MRDQLKRALAAHGAKLPGAPPAPPPAPRLDPGPPKPATTGLYLLEFRLRFGREAQFHFFHGAALYAYVLDRLGNPDELPPGIAIYPVEAGRVRYLAGDHYHFGMALRQADGPTPADWIRTLAAPPQTAFGQSPRAPFGAGLAVERVTDPLSGATDPARFTTFAPAALAEPAPKLAARKHFTFFFRTPLLVRRGDRRQEEVFDGEFADAGTLFARAARTVSEWFPDVPLPPELPVGLAIRRNGLVHGDLSYPKKRIPGAVGRVEVECPHGVGAWALPLLLAGMIGVGKTTNMGQGRYTIDEAPLPFVWPPPPAQTLAERCAAPRHLDAARRAVAEAGPTPGVDGVGREAFLDGLTFQEGVLARVLAQGEVGARPLRGLVLRERPGKYRALAVPTMRDRYLQRVALEELRPAFDQLLEDSSFAYRAGLCRRTAQAGISRAQDEGYVHLFEADIASFFDEVDWGLLEDRLRALLRDDPIVAVLMAWVKAPVEFGGRTVERTMGLPQGTVVSPMLANVYLDAFDKAMAARGRRLVRYADDFVVMCRTRDDAAKARQEVEEELGRLRLRLKEEKSGVTSFEAGFKFLGSVFCRTMVFDSPPTKSGDGPEVIDSVAAFFSDASALHAATGWAKRLTPEGKLVEEGETRWRSPVPRASPERRVAYVVQAGGRTTGTRRGVEVTRDGQVTVVPWRQLRAVFVLGGHFCTSSLYQMAMRNGVPVSFHRRDGEPVGLVLPDRVRSPTIRAVRQWEWLLAGRGIAAGRALIEAKIHNQRLLLRRAESESAEVAHALSVLATLGREAQRAESAETLRGIEGSAARTWFATWPELLPKSWEWPGRTGRRASDPINAMLNLLYTLLMRRTHLSILVAGLDPFAGFVHVGRDRYAALAADLMEPFRFLADRVVLSLTRNGRITAADFIRSEKAMYPCMLSEHGFERVLTAWEEVLFREVATGGDDRRSFDVHLQAQAEALGELVEGGRASFPAFRMKW